MGASLVVLAAGMGSRYGGLKQIDTFGPNGESLLEYAVYDALQAGFDHIVLIIREEFEEAFREKFATMLSSCPRYDLVYQDPDPDVAGIDTLKREKPRGTMHAVLSAAEVVDQPFAVVNADDRYGTTSYRLVYNHLQEIHPDEAYLVGYVLGNTMSEHGNVNRGVCDIDHKHMTLRDVKEHYAITYTPQRAIEDRDGYSFTGDEIVSMNFWAFHPDFFKQSLPLFELFVRVHAAEPKAEMPIPSAVDVLVKQDNLTCKVLQSQDPRQGVTNAEDKTKVQQAFDTMITNGLYPTKLRLNR